MKFNVWLYIVGWDTEYWLGNQPSDFMFELFLLANPEQRFTCEVDVRIRTASPTTIVRDKISFFCQLEVMAFFIL